MIETYEKQKKKVHPHQQLLIQLNLMNSDLLLRFRENSRILSRSQSNFEMDQESLELKKFHNY